MMNPHQLARFAVAGLVGSSIAVHPGLYAMDDMSEAEAVDEESVADEAAADSKYSKVHDCAGLNVCKGLGGCHVSAEKLTKLATAAGVPIEKAGTPHECAGLNECKGLGGCKVTAEKFEKLQAKQAKKAEKEAAAR